MDDYPPPRRCRGLWCLAVPVVLVLAGLSFEIRTRDSETLPAAMQRVRNTVTLVVEQQKPVLRPLVGFTRNPPDERVQCVPRAASRYDARGRVGFVFSAVGKYAKGLSYKCVAAIESLVTIGGWGGPVYLAVEKGERCLNETLLREAIGSDNIHVIHKLWNRLKDPRPDGFKFNLKGRQMGAAGLGKTVKGAMLDLVGPEGPEVLIYHDCDKLVAVPGCVEAMVRQALPFGPRAAFFVSHWKPTCPPPGEKGHCGETTHAGVVAGHRDWSKPNLRAWGQWQLDDPNSYDRRTLWKSWNSTRLSDGSRYGVGSLPPAYADHMWEASQPPGCINHISGGRCRDNPKRAARNFVQSLCLTARPPQDVCPTRRNEEWCGGL